MRKSCTEAALLLSAVPSHWSRHCVNKALLEGLRREGVSVGAFLPLLPASSSFNASGIFFNFVDGRSAASKPYFALCSCSLNLLSPPRWFEKDGGGVGGEKKKRKTLWHINICLNSLSCLMTDCQNSAAVTFDMQHWNSF